MELLASKDRHHTALRALGRAILHTEEMLMTKSTGGIPFKPTRTLEKSELESLSDAYMRMRSAQDALKKDPHNSYVGIDAVCASDTVVRRFAFRGIVSVLDAWNYDPKPLYGIIDECEALGVKGQQHLYFFAQY